MFFFSFGCNAYGILASQPGIEPTPPALEAKVLTTEVSSGEMTITSEPGHRKIHVAALRRLFRPSPQGLITVLGEQPSV